MVGDPKMRPINFGAEVISGFAFKSEDFSDAGIPVVKIKNVNNRLVDLTETEFFPSEKVTEKHERFFLKDGDVLIAMTGQGSVGRVGKLRLSVPQRVLLNQRVGRFSTDPKKLDLDYLYYVISTPTYEQILFNAGSGSGQPNLSPSVICSVEIPVPTLAEQKDIAAVLCALDDKIELNRRTGRALERVARALFRAWFVDFEPVKAKASGARSFPGMPQEVFDALPNHLVESELGPVPEGWGVGSVEDIARYVNGRPFTKHANDTGRMIIRIAELNSGPGASTKYSDVDAAPDNTAFTGDILFAWSGSLDVYRWFRDEAIINQHIFKVIPRKVPAWFVYYQLREAMPFFKAIASHKATTMGHIQRHHVDQAKLAIPANCLMTAADNIINPMFTLGLELERESIRLAEIRDYLLPQLLSGRRRLKSEVTNAERT
jgi:type I restriction enzyme S subunit